MSNADKIQAWRAPDVIEKIKTARDEADAEARTYKNDTANGQNYWRVMAAGVAYHEALEMFASATEHKIPNMATEAIAKSKRAHDNDPNEIVIAFADGRRDALLTVVDLMEGGWME